MRPATGGPQRRSTLVTHLTPRRCRRTQRPRALPATATAGTNRRRPLAVTARQYHRVARLSAGDSTGIRAPRAATLLLERLFSLGPGDRERRGGARRDRGPPMSPRDRGLRRRRPHGPVASPTRTTSLRRSRRLTPSADPLRCGPMGRRTVHVPHAITVGADTSTVEPDPSPSTTPHCRSARPVRGSRLQAAQGCGDRPVSRRA